MRSTYAKRQHPDTIKLNTVNKSGEKDTLRTFIARLRRPAEVPRPRTRPPPVPRVRRRLGQAARRDGGRHREDGGRGRGHGPGEVRRKHVHGVIEEEKMY